MKLLDLDPRWFGLNTIVGVAKTIRLGLTFQCPCCIGTERETRLAVPFDPPIDPNKLLSQTTWVQPSPVWAREGDTFADLTLSPSVDASAVGHWHGFITNGVVS